MRCGIAIKGNDARSTRLSLQRFAEQEFGRRYIATSIQFEINRLAFRFDGSVEISQDARYFEIGLINAPGLA